MATKWSRFFFNFQARLSQYCKNTGFCKTSFPFLEELVQFIHYFNIVKLKRKNVKSVLKLSFI